MRSLRSSVLIPLLVLVAACAEAPDDDTIVVGFAQTGNESDWRKAETVSIKAEAEKRGIVLKFSDGENKQKNQITALRNFIRQKVDVILLAPEVSTGWDKVLREAQEAGIPVILVSRGVESGEELYETLIASDFVEEGRAAARWLVEKTGGKARIIELQGTPGSDCARERQEGFMEVLAGREGMQILASQSGDFRRGDGKTVMQSFLKKHEGQIDAVFAHNDDMALGAIEAMKDAGLKPGEDVTVVSVDGVRAAFDAMVAGTLNCCIECPPLHGPAAFDAVQKVLDGETLPKRTTIELTVFDQLNAAEFIDQRAY